MAVASCGEKKHWWLTNRKMVQRYVREAKMLAATGDVLTALRLSESALALSPRLEVALEMKARCLLHLRRFKDVADMLQDYIPSAKMAVVDETTSSESSSTQMSKEQVKLLSSDGGDLLVHNDMGFKCFSASDLKKKLVAGLWKNVEEEGHWRYSVLGQACCHLGLMEDAMVLLQTEKRLATAAFRRESGSFSDDTFTFNKFPLANDLLVNNNQQQNQTKTESERISQLVCQIKLLFRRKTAAMAALDAGLFSEAIRHFSKIVDGRRGAPPAFLSECYVHRAVAFKSAGRLAEAIADCNRALALDTSCIQALTVRATLFETLKCLPESLHDLEHLKLLYNSIMRDRKLPSPIWRRQSVHYREIPGKLCSLTSRIRHLKQKVAAGETGCVDYYALIGLRKGCSRSEAERAHLLLTIKHKPDKSSIFIERCEFSGDMDVDSVRDRARLSAVSLFRLIQKGYNNVTATILEEEVAAEKRRKKAASQAAVIQILQVSEEQAAVTRRKTNHKVVATPPSSVFQGVFCRDLSAVGNLLSQAGFNRQIPLKYEALSC